MENSENWTEKIEEVHLVDTGATTENQEAHLISVDVGVCGVMNRRNIDQNLTVAEGDVEVTVIVKIRIKIEEVITEAEEAEAATGEALLGETEATET